MEPLNLDNIIVALLFASDEPLSLKRISTVLDEAQPQEIRESIARVERKFGSEDSAIRLEQVAGGFQLSTSAAYSDYVARLYRGRRKQRLSRAAMEALAIIAYKQPVTRADIENLRGVGCGGVITTLMERSLIRIVGKAKVLGSPFLYGTTQEFLEYLGLNSLKDLPSMEDLEALLAAEAASEPGDEINGEITSEADVSDSDERLSASQSSPGDDVEDEGEDLKPLSTTSPLEESATDDDVTENSTGTVRTDEQTQS